MSDWINDTAEALAIGAQIGERVIVIGSATGATLATLAANDPQLATGIDALVLLSPSYGASSRLAGGLALPMARRWAPLLVGETQEIVAQSPDHAKFWTLSYPTVAALPMAAAADAARGLNVEAISIPALLLYSETDRVVAPGAIREMARRWGGPVRIEPRVLGPDDDTNGHVLAGDILSPGQTDATITLICDWIQALG